MKRNTKSKIFLVDDDVVFLKSLEIDFLGRTKHTVVTFTSGELCLARLDEKPDLVILDYHLDGVERSAINGLETLDRIKAFNKNIPVIILSSQDKIDVAVRCMHHHALDYVIKSETAFFRLQKNITDLSRIRELESQVSWYMART